MPTTATFLGYPFDQELFMQLWREVPDPRLTAMIQSGAMVSDQLIRAQIQNDGNYYTIPFYNVLTGDEHNYDGMTDIVPEETSGTSQSGIVYGRSKAFSARDFVAELSGSNPMGHIATTFAKYWQNREQVRLLGIINGLFGITGGSNPSFTDEFVTRHSLDTGSPVEVTDANRLMTRSMGDHKGEYRMAIMHSIVAERLENLQVLNFWTYTEANGMQRRSSMADWNGLTVIIDDSVPVDTVTGKYTTYLFGAGVLRTAEGRLDNPVGVDRDELRFGGYEFMATRIRRTVHPNGFKYNVPTTGWTQSPTDAQLFAPANWEIIFNPKAIAIARLITEEGVII
jgi:hypothetical protein